MKTIRLAAVHGSGIVLFFGAILLLFMALSCLSGCSGAIAGPTVTEPEAKALGLGELCFIEAEEGVNTGGASPDPDNVECSCGGTGRSGDKLGPCVCGSNCQCSRGAEPISSDEKVPYSGPLLFGKYHFVMETNEACGPCQAEKTTTIPELKRRGYRIGIQEVPFTRDGPPLPRWITANRPTTKIIGRQSPDYLEQVLNRKAD